MPKQARQFLTVVQSLSTMGVSSLEIKEVAHVLMAVLHLGNVDFVERTAGGSQTAMLSECGALAA